MRRIPDDLREEMSNDPFYTRCAVTGSNWEKIDWHHNLIFAGRQVNEPWAIIPLARSIHDDIVMWQDHVDWIMTNRASDEQLRPYCKVINWIRRREKLNERFGAWQPSSLPALITQS